MNVICVCLSYKSLLLIFCFNRCPVSEYVSDLHTDETVNPNFAFTSRVFRFTRSDSDSVSEQPPVGGLDKRLLPSYESVTS